MLFRSVSQSRYCQRDDGRKLFVAGLDGQGLKPYVFGSVADFEQGDPLLADEGQLPQVMEAIDTAVVLRYHAKTRSATIHSVQLLIERKPSHARNKVLASVIFPCLLKIRGLPIQNKLKYQKLAFLIAHFTSFF